MNKTYFENTFKNLQVPVIVCENRDSFPVVHANSAARLFLNPLLTTEKLRENEDTSYLHEMLRFENEALLDSVLLGIAQNGYVEEFRADIITKNDMTHRSLIWATMTEFRDGQYLVFYIRSEDSPDSTAGHEMESMLSFVFNIAFQNQDVEAAINNVMAYIGAQVDVSRVYIFEEISAETTSNTYEWCAPGIEPAIDELKDLKKADYNYDAIIADGMYITDDVRDLPDIDREILEEQNIKALAILTLMDGDRAIGYVGFDDCNHYRKWDRREIDLLSITANILVSLLNRRNWERMLNQSLDILQTISDNIDSVIYVNDIETYDIVFLNKAMADSLGMEADQLIGKKCWQNIQKDMDGPCAFCPIPKMLGQNGQILHDTYRWEFQNTLTGKWYMIKDSIITWINGRKVHIETALDITDRKAYEKQLEDYASIDMMTGVYNRMWGYRIMEEMLKSPLVDQENISLVFIDLDGLKAVNDRYGHAMGDAMILQVVDVLREHVRRNDVICRWGGDEFLMLLQCNVQVAQKIIRDIDAQFKAINDSGKNAYLLSASYGVTPFDAQNLQGIDTVISRADKLMYKNKVTKRQDI